jgi:glycosyltransferase involved in cell wall biosynthesis
MSIKISLIITTYNRPNALIYILRALSAQTMQNFEVIIADDGSTQETADNIEKFCLNSPYTIQHSWQADMGFRAARARNQAILRADGDYLIFLDGDCVPFPDFIARHCQLAESGYFVAGNRILLSRILTRQLIENLDISSNFQDIWHWRTMEWFAAYFRKDINRVLPLLRLPDGFFRKYTQKWQGAKTCNLGVWHENILKINGFNEDFQGWGHEDAECVVRLLKSGVKRKEGRFSVPVLHLWHLENDRSQELQNRQRLEKMLYSQNIIAEHGLKSKDL